LPVSPLYYKGIGQSHTPILLRIIHRNTNELGFRIYILRGEIKVVSCFVYRLL